MPEHLADCQLHPIVRRWFCIDLPCVDYSSAWALQAELVRARKDRRIERDIVLFLEHLPVLTLGRRGGINNLTVSANVLKEAGVPVIHVERGGDITYHGPGQLIVYPIVDLTQANLKALDYVSCLEQAMIKTAADWGIRASRHPLNRGVWVGSKKLGSVGIAVRHGITFHGLALNVNVDLTPFQWINPCGLAGISMTSMAREASQNLSMGEVREATKRHMKTIFEVELLAIHSGELHGLLNKFVPIHW